MDLRKELRFEMHQELEVTVLGKNDLRTAAKVVNFSGNGLCLEINQTLCVGTAVRIEIADGLLLGEVVHCRKLLTGAEIGIRLEHALHHLRSLRALSDRLLGQEGQPRNDATPV
jgi:hypothetical protein